MVKYAGFLRGCAVTVVLSMSSFAWAEDTLVTLPPINVRPIQGQSLVIERPAGNNGLFWASRIALYGATAADLGTTWRAMNAGYVEANPILGQSRAVQGAIVAGSVVALTLLTQRLYHNGHPRLATVLNLVVAGEHGFAAWYNSRN